jgi:hypothetical protein
MAVQGWRDAVLRISVTGWTTGWRCPRQRDAAQDGLEGGLAMEERSDESFSFMEELVATWLEGARCGEIARVLDAIKAELDRRGASIPPRGSSSGRCDTRRRGVVVHPSGQP